MALLTVSYDQIAGCLVGQCLADALAAPVRGGPAELCQSYAQEKVRPWLQGGPLTSLPEPLFYTDGSQLACELLSCLVEEGGFRPSRWMAQLNSLVRRRWIAQRYLETHLAAKAFAQTGSCEQTGVDSQGFGSVHRAAVVALRHATDQQQRRALAYRQSMLTHRNPLCGAAAAVLADLVAAVVRGEATPDRLRLELVIPEDIAPLGESLQHLPELLSLEPEAALPRVLKLSVSGDVPTQEDLPDQVLPALMWSLYCVLRSQWDYVAAVSLAMSAGGEVIGPAAVTGALCGAHAGLSLLPGALLERLTDRGMPALPKLRGLAARCQAALSVDTLNSPPESEQSVAE